MRKQLELELNGGRWGGLRENCGRKEKHSKGVSHKGREPFTSRTPLHINLKSNHPLRNETGLKALKKAIWNARIHVSILHYSLETNHIHLIIEAENVSMLEKGMRSFTATMVKSMKKGKLQSERYHLHVLRTPQETRNVFRYVLLNHSHHTKLNSIKADEYNSLHTLDLKAISKLWKISVIESRIKNPIELDSPSTWLAKNAYS